MHTTEIPLPPDAVKVFDWYDENDPLDAPPAREVKPGVSRYFLGSSWVVKTSRTDVSVYIDGMQYHDGTVCRHVVLDDDAMTPQQARALGAALIAAADEADRMAQA
jgi:hypothetical protein